MSAEVWKVVPQHPFLEASSRGRIRRRIAGDGPRAPVGHIFLPRIKRTEKFPYPYIRVFKDRKRWHLRPNRLVCMAFHGKPPTREHHAAHKDGNVWNNDPSNLYWATPQQNIDDRERHGRTVRGENKHNTKLKNKDIPKIRKLLAAGRTVASIADAFAVSIYPIQDIKRGKSWRHIR